MNPLTLIAFVLKAYLTRRFYDRFLRHRHRPTKTLNSVRLADKEKDMGKKVEDGASSVVLRGSFRTQTINYDGSPGEGWETDLDMTFTAVNVASITAEAVNGAFGALATHVQALAATVADSSPPAPTEVTLDS